MKLFIYFFFIFSLFSQDFDRSEWNVWRNYKGCINVREKVLIDHSLVPVKMSKDGCSIVSGKWIPIFENKIYTNPKEIDIDHTVPLSWAWKHGANEWSKVRKQNYANNYEGLYYLLPLSAFANRSKGDKGPDEWLPNTNKCSYIKIFESIVIENKLILTDIEKIKYSEIKKRECP